MGIIPPNHPPPVLATFFQQNVYPQKMKINKKRIKTFKETNCIFILCRSPYRPLKSTFQLIFCINIDCFNLFIACLRQKNKICIKLTKFFLALIEIVLETRIRRLIFHEVTQRNKSPHRVDPTQEQSKNYCFADSVDPKHPENDWISNFSTIKVSPTFSSLFWLAAVYRRTASLCTAVHPWCNRQNIFRHRFLPRLFCISSFQGCSTSGESFLWQCHRSSTDGLQNIPMRLFLWQFCPGSSISCVKKI